MRLLHSLPRRPHHRLIPRVTLVWAGLTAALLVLYPHRGPIVHFASTNLANLGDHPFGAIGLSMLVLANGWGEWATWLALSIVWILVEASVGWRRSLVVFVAGHVLATVAVALFESASVLSGDSGSALVHLRGDVGASYGFLALAGLGLATAVRRDRRWLLVVPALIAATVTDVGSWTILGHAIAVGVGVSAGAWLSDPFHRPVVVPAIDVGVPA